jgi:hypothetical protein
MKLLITVFLIAFLAPVISHSKDLKAYGKDCEKIGFKPKTPAYGKCILELSRDDITNTSQQKVEKPVEHNQTASLPAGYVRTKNIISTGAIKDRNDRTSMLIGRNDKMSMLNGSGTLVWSNNTTTADFVDGKAIYVDALKTCNAMNASSKLGFNNGWRLPSQQELSGLLNSDIEKLKLNYWRLDGTWTSEPFQNDSHFYVHLDSGMIREIFDIFSYSVTCVHESND